MAVMSPFLVPVIHHPWPWMWLSFGLAILGQFSERPSQSFCCGCGGHERDRSGASDRCPVGRANRGAHAAFRDHAQWAVLAGQAGRCSDAAGMDCPGMGPCSGHPCPPEPRDNSRDGGPRRCHIGDGASVLYGAAGSVRSPSSSFRTFAASRSGDLSVLWRDRLAAIGKLPRSAILLAEPRVAYEIAGFSGREVVAVPVSHTPVQVQRGDGSQRREARPRCGARSTRCRRARRRDRAVRRDGCARGHGSDRRGGLGAACECQNPVPDSLWRPLAAIPL